MNKWLVIGCILCSVPVLALVAYLYVRWILYWVERFEDSIGIVLLMAFMPLLLPGIILVVIGLL